MNKSSITLWVDTDTNNLLTGFNTNAVANNPTFKQGDNFEVDIHFLKRYGNASIELPTAGSSYKLAIGNPDALPTSGSWVLAYGSSQVEFDYNESAASVEASLNLIPEIIADGGVTVALVNGDTTYRISFNNKVGLSSSFTTDSSNLIPSSYATVSQIKTGSATTRGVWHIKLKQIPVAYQSTWTHSTSPTTTVTALDSNTVRVEINPAPKDGTFVIRYSATPSDGTPTSYARTPPISVFATEAMVADAINLPTEIIVNKSGLYSWDITILDRTYQSNGGGVVTVSHLVTDADGAGIIGYDFVTGAISLNNYEVSALLGGEAFVDTVLEVEVTTGSTVATVLQTTCRIVADVIAQGIYAPIPFDNPISQADLDSSLLNYVQKSGGTMSLNANLGFSTSSSTTQVGGSTISIDSVGLVNQTAITHDGVTITDADGSLTVEATGITFPDGTTQTSATATVDLSGLVSKTATGTQAIVSALTTSEYFATNYATAEPTNAFNTFGQGLIQISRNQGASAMSGTASADGDSNWMYQVADGESYTLSHRFVTDTLYTNKMVYAGEFNDGGMYGLGLKYTTNLGTFVETVIYPTGIKFPDASVQTTAGYPRYGNPENFQTYYDVANNYYPLNSNPSGYLHEGDNGTVPAGGLAGQVLTKATNDSYVLSWENLPSLSGYALLSGAVFSGKVSTTATSTTAPLNIGVSTTAPTTTVAGDIWVGTNNVFFKDSANVQRALVNQNTQNTFTTNQIITGSSTLPMLRITQTGTVGNAFVVEDGTPNPNDTSAFVVNNDGSVGIAVDPATWTTTNKLEVQGTALFGGKANFTSVAGQAGLNIGIGGTNTSATVAGDMWITTGGANLNFRDGTGAWKVLASLSNGNTFTQPQIIQTVTTASLPPLRLVNQATTSTVHSFVVEDSNPDTDSFVIDNFGNVGIGVDDATGAWTATQKLELNGNIKFLADSSVQTTAYIPSNVALTGGTINGSTITIDGGTY